jgi:hypothetical protein
MLRNEFVTMYTAAHYKNLLFASNSMLERVRKSQNIPLGLTYSGWTVNSAVFLDFRKNIGSSLNLVYLGLFKSLDFLVNYIS